MNNQRLLAASIFFLGCALIFDKVVPDAHAQAAPEMVCEEGFTSPAGIKRDKLQDWMAVQHAAGRTNYLPFGVQGTVRIVCAW